MNLPKATLPLTCRYYIKYRSRDPNKKEWFTIRPQVQLTCPRISKGKIRAKKSQGKENLKKLFREWLESQEVAPADVIYEVVDPIREDWKAKHPNIFNSSKKFNPGPPKAKEVPILEDPMIQGTGKSLGHSKHRQVPRKAHKSKG